MSEYEQRVPAVGVARVTIEAARGDVAVAWRAGGDLLVRGDDAEIDSHGDELVIARHGHHGGRLTVTLPEGLPACMIAVRRGNLELENARGRLDVQVERGNLRLRGGQAEVALRSGSGNVGVEELTGPLTLESGSGDIRLGRVDGPVEVRTGSGNVVARGGSGDLTSRTGSGNTVVDGRIGGRLSIATGSGNVEIAGGRADSTEVNTGAGNIRCRTVLGVGAHALVTNSGNLTVAVPRGLSARIEAVTTLGNIRSELPLVSVGQRGPKSLFGRRLVGSLGEGSERAEISLRTARGDLRLEWLDGRAGFEAGAWPEVDVDIRLGDIGMHVDRAVEAATAAAVAAAGWPFAQPTPPTSPTPPTPPTPPTSPTPPTPPTPPDVIYAPPASPTAERRADDAADDALFQPPDPAPSPQMGRAEPAFLPDPEAGDPPAVQPAGSDREAEQRQILEALAAGRLTVADAERLLTALEDDPAAR
jgi:hypothetical protein